MRRTASVALPPGRSVKKTRTSFADAAERNCVSMSSALSPRFVSATKSFPSPAICSTALTRPSANAACPATIARGPDSAPAASPSALFVIFLEILPDVACRGLAHPADQSLVENLCRVDSRIAQQMIEGDHFGDHRDVLAGIERNRDERDLHSQYFRRVGVESGAVDHCVLVPFLESH